MANFNTVIFDLDGLLIDSEPLWEEAETQVFARYGVHITKDICLKVKGFRVDESIRLIHRLFPFPNPDFTFIEQQILEEVKRLIREKGKGMPGCVYILHFFKSRNFKLALASSSKLEIIYTALEKLNIEQHFDCIHSAENEPFGKPHPGIFLTAASRLQSDPSSCIVFEDSLNGVIAGRAARMTTVAIPDPEVFEHKGFGIAHLRLTSLLQFKELHLYSLGNSELYHSS